MKRDVLGWLVVAVGLVGLVGCNGAKETDTHTDTHTHTDTGPETQTADCESLCSLALGCEDVPSSAGIFGATQAECEERCTQSMEWSMSECTRSASDCAGLVECTRLTTNDDIGVCEAACDLVVNECGFTSDVGQCGIDCSMVLGQFAGDYFGAGLQCWQAAVDEGDCAIAEQCPAMYF